MTTHSKPIPKTAQCYRTRKVFRIRLLLQPALTILILGCACKNDNKQENGVAEYSETTKQITDSAFSNPMSDNHIQMTSEKTNEEDRFNKQNMGYMADTSTIIITHSSCEVPYTCYAGETDEEAHERELKALKEEQINLDLLNKEEPERTLEENKRILHRFGTSCWFDFYINCIDSIELIYLEFPLFGYKYKFTTNEKTKVWLSNRDSVRVFLVGGRTEDDLSASVINKKKSLYLKRKSIIKSFHDDYNRSEVYFNFHIVVNGKSQIEIFKLMDWHQI